MTESDWDKEQAAAEIIAALVGAARLEKRDVPGARPGTHDYDLHVDDHVIALEVTSSTDGEVRSFWDTESGRTLTPKAGNRDPRLAERPVAWRDCGPLMSLIAAVAARDPTRGESRLVTLTGSRRFRMITLIVGVAIIVHSACYRQLHASELIDVMKEPGAARGLDPDGFVTSTDDAL